MTDPRLLPALAGALDHDGWHAMTAGLLRYARRLGAPLEEAEDLVHDALEVFARRPAAFDPALGSLQGWLRTIVRRRFVDGCRRRDTARRHRGHLALVEPTDGAASARRAGLHRRRVLAELTEREQALFLAWAAQVSGRLDQRSAAERAGLTRHAYETGKRRLERKLPTVLQRLGLEPSDLMGGE